VATSGRDGLGAWQAVERNIPEDYRTCFGDDEDPPDVIAIGLMTDTDNTKGEALAYFDAIRIGAFPVLSTTTEPETGEDRAPVKPSAQDARPAPRKDHRAFAPANVLGQAAEE
jgi:hypothetical protein